MQSKPLYAGSLLRLTPLNIEKDAAAVSPWTWQPAVASQLGASRSAPMTSQEVRKVMETWRKDADNSGHTFVFSLRPLQDERLLGLFWMTYIQWVHGAGQFHLIIGDSQDWQVFSREALDLALNYAFDELNLFRLTVQVEEDNQPACGLYKQAQFYLEVRQRQAIFREGRYLDKLSFGMLRPEWEIYRTQEAAL